MNASTSTQPKLDGIKAATGAETVRRLRAAAGRDTAVISDPDILSAHLVDQRGWYRGEAIGLARPRTVAEVQAIVGACAELGVAIVPQGGNTSLCGGAVPSAGAEPTVILSTAALSQIRSVDAAAWTITAEAGCTLLAIQGAARTVHRHFGLDHGARATARIGGCLATNSGGMSVLRYGTARDLVLGLEIVLPDGRLFEGLRALRKDNSGYDLKQLFIGSEGTLGIITAATLKLHPQESHSATVLLTLSSISVLDGVLAYALERAAGRLSAIELLPAMGIRLACDRVLNVPVPIALDRDWYILLRFAATEPVTTLAEDMSSALLEAGLVEDAVVCQSARQEDTMWAIRDSFSTVHRHLGVSHRFDLAVPLGRMPILIENLFKATKNISTDAVSFAFGHIGDGNLHFSICQPPNGSAQEFDALRLTMEHAVNAVCWDLGGTVSAEHGIGQLHRHEIALQKGPVELDLMREIKSRLDPSGRFNPGKLLPG